MEKLNYIFILIFVVAISACSSGTEWEGPLPAPATKSPPTLLQNSTPQGSTPQSSNAPTVTPISENGGVVTEIVEVPETKMTYLELQNDKERFWIATSALTVEKGNKVKFDLNEGVVMQNFTSKALNRTFNQILLVANAQVVK